MKEYITHSVNKALKERKEYYLFDIPVYILQSLPKHINIENILNDLKEIVPYEFMSSLEGIYIGEFPELKDRNIQAVLRDGAIYLSSFKEFPNVTEEIILKDIIHEIAHLIEDNHYFEIYGDELLEREYLGKKRRLVDLLRANGITLVGMGKLFFSDDSVDELDDFLYKKVGYDNLSVLTAGLFSSPYSVTSIREYFANGLEDYLAGDTNYLKEISPALFKKINELLDLY